MSPRSNPHESGRVARPRTSIRALVLCAMATACGAPEAPVPGDAGADAFALDAGRGDTGLDAADAASADAGPPDTGACATPDSDSDGENSIACGGTDCDDTNAARNTHAVEICDAVGLDEDCDPTTLGTRDADGDGATSDACCNTDTAGAMHCGTDCDDANMTVHPGATEACDSRDNDCDTAIDEGVPPSTYYHDADGDGFGVTTESVVVCGPPPSYVLASGDCDDTNVRISPAATELCADLIDNNCNGAIDEMGPRAYYRDVDGDTYGDPSSPVMTTSCTAPAGYTDNSGDCNDVDGAVHPGAMEMCDRRDSNCSAGGLLEVAEDVDGDHHSPIGAACTGGFPTDDCRDDDISVYPGAPELCDRLDSDCSTGGGVAVDEDADGDRHAPVGTTTCAGGYPRDDCNDTNAAINPFAPETCDGFDDDCTSGGGALPSEDMDGDMHSAPGAACLGGFPRDDCQDGNAAIHPGAPELCDVLDDTCAINGGGALPREDMDGDLHAAVAAPCSGGYARDDCDDANPAIYPGAPIGVPAPLAPLNGALIGSASRASSLRPQFQWRDAQRGGCGAFAYELAVDDSCATPGFASCALPSPEVTATALTTTTFQPASGLAVSATAPVGRRYYWRVRRCEGATCSAWSTVRYVDLGRARSDFDGDGFSDVVVGVPSPSSFTDEGRAHVFRGRASGLATTPSSTLDGPSYSGGAEFGSALAAADVNGDGFGDLLVSARRASRAGCVSCGAVYVYLGSSTGLAATATGSVFGGPSNNTELGLATAVGDVDGDGFADLVAARTDSIVQFFPGSASGLASLPTSSVSNPSGTSTGQFGWTLAIAGDVNGDGFADMLVGATYEDVVAASGNHEGRAYVFHGSASGFTGAPARTLADPTPVSFEGFGSGVGAIGDANGDGYSDVAIGAPDHTISSAGPGVVYTYQGSAAGISPMPSQTVVNPAETGSGMGFGDGIESSDLDGDGSLEVIVSSRAFYSWTTTGGYTRGAVYVYEIAGGLLPATPTTTLGPNLGGGPPHVNFGVSVANAGDVNGDGFTDLAVGMNPTADTPMNYGRAYVFPGSATGASRFVYWTLDDPMPADWSGFGNSVVWATPPRAPRREADPIGDYVHFGLVPTPFVLGRARG